MLLQFVGDKPDVQSCAKPLTLTALQSGDALSVKVGDFKKKTQRRSDALNRKCDFLSRCHNHKELRRRMQT